MDGQPSYTLQHCIVPGELCQESRLYYRVTAGIAWHDSDVQALKLQAGAKVSFNTWFNGFSIGKWHQHTDLSHFQLRLKGTGSVKVTLYHHDEEHKTGRPFVTELSQKYILGHGVYETVIELPSQISTGRIFFTLEAIDNDASLTSAEWQTVASPARQVRLGLVITTFNRQEAVTQSAMRISAFLAGLPHPYRENMQLLIVDNGKNLSLPSLPNTKLIPNPNLGGSGGFARGLYYFKEEKEFTHCLFMDDDAACEPESIWRTYQLLSYARQPELAIAGALLKQNPPFSLYEKGANFIKSWAPLWHGKNLLYGNNLLTIEQEKPISYGAWWFFAFPVRRANYPFPFFVRGDDVFFGLSQEFLITTLNGVGTWGEDFSGKVSPFTHYLDVRYHLMLQLMGLKMLPVAYFYAEGFFIKALLRQLFRYRYASAQAIIIAMEDVLRGPEFWEKNADMKARLPILKELTAHEKLEPCSAKVYYMLPGVKNNRFPYIKRVLKIMTLNGHLVPAFMLSPQPVRLTKVDERLDGAFMRKRVLVYDPAEGCRMLEQNKKTFFHLLLRGASLSFLFFWRFLVLRKAYNQALNRLTSKDFWVQWFFGKENSAQ